MAAATGETPHPPTLWLGPEWMTAGGRLRMAETAAERAAAERAAAARPRFLELWEEDERRPRCPTKLRSALDEAWVPSKAVRRAFGEEVSDSEDEEETAAAEEAAEARGGWSDCDGYETDETDDYSCDETDYYAGGYEEAAVTVAGDTAPLPVVVGSSNKTPHNPLDTA